MIGDREKLLVPSFAKALEEERHLGMTEAWFYVKYGDQIQLMRQWIDRQITFLHTQGHTIVAYGATIKSMVLLHYLLDISDRRWNISYIIEDVPMKRSTSIPIYNISILQNFNSNDTLTILVLEWRLWKNISNKIQEIVDEKENEECLCYTSFPVSTIDNTQIKHKFDNNTKFIQTITMAKGISFSTSICFTNFSLFQ